MDMDKLVALCRRRGFIFQSSEIYGGINGFWDYGPLGVELKRNIKEVWWHDMVQNPPLGPDGQEISMVGVDCAIIMNPRVWEASGHAAGFADQMVDCKLGRKRFRTYKGFCRRVFESEASLPQIVLAVEADSPVEAQKLLGAEHDRLLKKRKVPGDLVPSTPLESSRRETLSWKRRCPVPGCEGELTEPRQFNLMF